MKRSERQSQSGDSVRRFGVTYEGLKHERLPIKCRPNAGFGVTYEGLKLDRAIDGAADLFRFGVTYEGLKLLDNPEVCTFYTFWSYL